MIQKKQIQEKKFSIMALLLVSLFVFSACTLTPPTATNTTQTIVVGDGTYIEATLDLSEEATIQRFESEEAYQDYIRQQSSSTNGLYGARMAYSMADGAVATKEIAMDIGASSQGVQYSETNVQVAGVDEADILKTDGEYIYTVTDQTLHIIKAYPGEEAEEVSQISVDGYGANLFVKDDLLAVFGTEQSSSYSDIFGFLPQNQISYLRIYDISDKENPELASNYSFEGSYFNARETNGEIYLVLRLQPEVRDIYPTPVLYKNGIVERMPVDKMYYLPNPHARGTEMITVHKLDFKKDAEISSLAVTSDYIQDIYMSHDNLYLIGSEYINEEELEWQIVKELLSDTLDDEDKLLIEKIKKTDNDVLTQAEKEQKIQAVYYSLFARLTSDEQEDLEDALEKKMIAKLEEMEHFEYAKLTKIHLEDVTVSATTKVPGRINNQFSLDEHDDNLRLATTISPRWSRYIDTEKESTNNVWVLDNNLKQIGSLEGLAEGERIYSTRFIQDRLYLVTYKQVDPFFVIDLSEPTNPTSLGELKIPGFSTYLHPYDDNHIIGIGKETSEAGRTKGLKISLFNVEDVSDPKEVAKYVTTSKYANSQALYEHKAFLFSKEKNLLVIPAYSYDWREDGNEESYNGAFVFNITTDEIALRGLIDHSKSKDTYRYGANIKRSLYIDNLLYTKSPHLLRINDLDTLEGVKNVELVSTTTDIPVY